MTDVGVAAPLWGEFRVYMVVPRVVVTETDNPLTYELFGKKFDLR